MPRGKIKLKIVPHIVCKTTRTQNVFNVVVAVKMDVAVYKKGIISTLDIFSSGV